MITLFASIQRSSRHAVRAARSAATSPVSASRAGRAGDPGGWRAGDAGRPGHAPAEVRRRGRRAERTIAAVMGAIAASLAAMAFVHLDGILAGAPPFRATHAGTVEILIGLVLAAGAAALLRAWPRARGVALAATAFAIAGFLVGLSFTARSGEPADIAYHAAGLPLLLGTLAAIWRLPRRPANRSAQPVTVREPLPTGGAPARDREGRR